MIQPYFSFVPCQIALADYTALATATDNCDAAVVITQSPAIGSTHSGDGTVVLVTLTATDDAGNTSTCSITVEVIDDENPEITCPADITIGTDAGVCQTAVTVPAIAVSDECGILSIVNDYTGTSDASATYLIGTTTIVWTVTDIHGNFSEGLFAFPLR